MEVRIFSSEEKTIGDLSESLLALIKKRECKSFSVALSGGDTAKKMFKFWRENYSGFFEWRNVLFFWVDERCVAADSDESNFKHANEIFFGPLGLGQNVFEINGASEPAQEAQRYSDLSVKMTASSSPYPDFDCAILGMGNDGHCASIFPESADLLVSDQAYKVSRHPKTFQKRITMTGSAILNSHEIFMLVLGKEKEQTLINVIDEVESQKIKLPSAYILKNAEDAVVFTNSLSMQI